MINSTYVLVQVDKLDLVPPKLVPMIPRLEQLIDRELDEAPHLRDFYYVSGRLIGDNEDSGQVFKCGSREEASDAFVEWMWDISGYGPDRPGNQAERELREINGEGAIINSICRSRTPIFEV